jgi:zinc protease
MKHATLAVFLLIASCTARAQRDEPPTPQPLGRVDFPSYEKRVLPNGLTVYAIEYHEQPVVALRMLIAAGAEYDPPNLPGVAAFTADLLNQGTRTKTATQIADAIERVGGTLQANADMESTSLSTAVLADNAGLAFELMNDILINPAFAQEELARSQQQSLSGLAAQLEDPDFIADAVFNREIYGKHPYGHLEPGTPNSIPKIKRDDLVKFHDTYYAPNISALAIVGDLKAADAFKLAEQWFGSWQKKDVPRRSDTELPKLQGRRIVVIDKPDSVQTEIRVGETSVPRKDPDYFNLLMASYILGGSAGGRLNRTLRVERGLTYGAYATIVPRRGPGSFFATTDTRTEKTAEALRLVFEEIDKLRTVDVPPQELTDAKSFIIGSFPLNIEVPSDLATRLVTVFLYDLGDDYLKTYRDRLANISEKNVQKASNEKLSGQNAVAVLVGNASAFKSELESMGTTEVIPIDKLNVD